MTNVKPLLNLKRLKQTRIVVIEGKISFKESNAAEIRPRDHRPDREAMIAKQEVKKREVKASQNFLKKFLG